MSSADTDTLCIIHLIRSYCWYNNKQVILVMYSGRFGSNEQVYTFLGHF